MSQFCDRRRGGCSLSGGRCEFRGDGRGEFERMARLVDSARLYGVLQSAALTMFS